MDSMIESTTLPLTLTSPLPETGTNSTSAEPKMKLLSALRKQADSSSEDESDSEDDFANSSDRIISSSPDAQLNTFISVPQIFESSEDEGSDGGSAYERMKQKLLAKKSSNKDLQPSSEATKCLSNKGSGDELPTREQADTTTPTVTRTNIISSHSSPSQMSRAVSRHSSPGLFVTPSPSPVKKRQRELSRHNGSDSDESPQSVKSVDMEERVRCIREKRLARQEEQSRQEIGSGQYAQPQTAVGAGSDFEIEIDQRLAQHAKPTRKAGKKAMEAMARDQQRISRNMQLTHQAKTKKRYTTKDLFARMGYQVPTKQAESQPTSDSSSVMASPDAEASRDHDTPPTSPATQDDIEDKDLLNKPKLPTVTCLDQKSLPPPPAVVGTTVARVHLPTTLDATIVELSDSDDDDRVAQHKLRFPVFNRMPTKKQQDSVSLLRLRSLAQLAKSPQRGQRGKKIVTLAEMESSLAQRAQEQRNKERNERIAELKQRGHVIETEEEREKRQMEIEDHVERFEKQREEDLKLAKMEKEEAKKNGEAIDDLSSSDESDSDFVESEDDVEDEQEPAHLELSGSEDEEGSQADNEVDGLIDEMAGEDTEPEESSELKKEGEHEYMEADQRVRNRTVSRPRKVVIDDEDDSDADVPNKPSQRKQPSQDYTMAAFGFGPANSQLGLTQMFVGTMANLASDSQPADIAEPEQNSLAFLRSLPATQPEVNLSQASKFMIPNSPSLASPQKTLQSSTGADRSLGISQFIKTSPAFPRTQIEDFEPTQDAGFSFSRSPAGVVAPPSTFDTVMGPIVESPVMQRKGRLQRGRREATVELSDVDDIEEDQDHEIEDDMQRPPKPSNAFIKMQKTAKKQKAIEEFNKKTSMAREAVMEQAEESEDEYAGLGGASDDEEGEDDEELEQMIDHGDVKVDERQIAAFIAEKAKKEDEKNIAELYKKIQTGGLRRHAAGNGFDMSDSEDEAEQRQRKKQADFHKMSRALLKDERVKQLADDHKKKAFFNTLADFADEGDYDFLDMPIDVVAGEEDDFQEGDGQSTGAQEDLIVPDSQAMDIDTPVAINPLKRKSSDAQKENRPPPQLRRTAASDRLARKPITLADVQNSVSELLDDPRVVVPDSQYSDTESDDDAPAVSKKTIVDRLTLSRTPTSESQPDGNIAFHAPSRAAVAPGFLVPSLIRRATSNLSNASDTRSSSGANTPTESAIRRGGTGKSNIHAQAREAERRALVERKDGKRKEALMKKVKGSRKAAGMRSVLRELGGGFE